MAFVPTANTVRVDVLQRQFGQNCDNTLYYYSAGGSLDITQMTALGNTIHSIYAASFAPFHTTSWELAGLIVTDQSSASGPAVGIGGAGVFGELDEDPMPNNVAWCVKFLTTGRGRSARGRNYVLDVPRSQVAGNEVAFDWAALVMAAYTQLLIPDLGVDATLCVVSHITAGAPRVAGLAQPVTAITYTDLTLDSQRRRLPGRGS